MDDATTSTDIRLREGASIAQRLVMSGFSAAVALCFTPGLFTRDVLEIVISVVALLVGAGFVAGIMMAPAVVWIITSNEILIGQQRPFGKLRTRVVPKDDISGLQVAGEGGVTGLVMLTESHLACHTYPEFGVATFNLYCCRERPAWAWEERLREMLGAREVQVRSVRRSTEESNSQLEEAHAHINEAQAHRQASGGEA